MGGNTYNRKFFKDDELLLLVQSSIDHPLKSIFSDRLFENEKQWRANVARYLDTDSSNRFYFLLATYMQPVHCKFCKKELSIASFNYRSGFINGCPTCVSNHAWSTSKYLEEDQLKKRGENISKTLLKFYQTDVGKMQAAQQGQHNSVALKSFFKTEQGAINKEKSRVNNSKLMKDNILSGKFTPNSNNRNTHWESLYNNKKYRSSWEAIYQNLYPSDEHEKLRIKYQYNGIESIYIVDFINHETKIVTEVKPRELCNDPKFIAKFDALTLWANHNGFTARIVDLEFIKLHKIPSDLSQFDEKTQRKILKIYAKTKN